MKRRRLSGCCCVVAGTLLAAGCTSSQPRTHGVSPVAAPTATSSRGTSSPPASSSVASTGNAVPRAVPAAASSALASATSANDPPAGRPLPIAVQSDKQMIDAGNHGPSSTILLPSSCTVNGDTVTASGGYSNGGFVPEDYRRYGDTIDLYVFTAPAHGYSGGVQIAVLSANSSPPVGASSSWRVSEQIVGSLGQPVRCVVAAQPTHDFEGAPNAY